MILHLDREGIFWGKEHLFETLEKEYVAFLHSELLHRNLFDRTSLL
jgi:hypothetical protein